MQNVAVRQISVRYVKIMSDQQFIEKNSKQITQILMQVQEKTIAELFALKGNLEAQEFVRLIEGLDIKQIVNAKSANAISLYVSSHAGILESIEGFAEITEETLQALVNFNAESLLNDIDNIAVNIKREVMKGAIVGVGKEGVLDELRKLTNMSEPQLKTIIDTGMNEYSRSVTRIMMEDMPDDTKYVYIGPTDEKTRTECLQMVASGEQTLEQINSFSKQFGRDVLINGGGYNCRHKWEIAVQDKFGHDPEGAKRRLNEEKRT